MKQSKILLFLSLILSLSLFSNVWSQSETPLPGLTLDQIKAIINAVSGERALNHIRYLTLYHRWFVSDGYHKAALYIQKKAEEIGLKDVEIVRFPSDGKIFYSSSKSLPKWTVNSAELSLMAPIKKHLASWEENPITLASNSRSADVKAELVDVGEGIHASDYEGKDIKGKLVLASAPQGKGRIELVHQLAVLERGAAGVISYRSYYLDDFPDLVTWDHIWTLELEGKQSTFGFCLSKRLGWELKRLLNQGKKVILQARIEAELAPGQFEIVTGHIPGTDWPDQEIWFIAHLDHCRPSANDNASGSASILETARSLTELFKSGILPQPRRTLRFFWVPEIYGTYAYLASRLKAVKKAVAVINMDMVGENQKICGSVFRITRTPDSTPSFLNDLLEMRLDLLLPYNSSWGQDLTNPLAIISPWGSRQNWRAEVIPYSGGSDHAVFMGGVINIPATMLGSWPDYFYHSSGDTPDKSDSTQLKRAVVYGTLIASSIANLDIHSGARLIHQIFPRCLIRMDKAIKRAQKLLEESQLTACDLKEALNILGWTSRREKAALGSVLKLLPDNKNIKVLIERLNTELDRHSELADKNLRHLYYLLCQQRMKKPETIFMTEEEKRASHLIPQRNPAFPGPIANDYFALKLKEKGLTFHSPWTGFQQYELGAFIDGKLSLLDIRNAVSAECGSIKLSDVYQYIKILEKIGLVSIKN